MASTIGGITAGAPITAIAQGGVNADLHPFLDVYSVEALHHARAVMMYEAFANRRIDLSAAPGQTVKFVTYNDLVRGGELSEGSKLETQGIGSSVKSISVSEYGNAIALSEKALQLSFDELMSEAAILLGRDYALTRDLYIRDQLVSGLSNTVFGNNVATQATVPAANINAGGGGEMNTDLLHEAVLQLQLANTPKFNNDYYVCFIHPHQASMLRRDQDWVNAHVYKDSDRALFRGEIGRYEDIIFIASTNQGHGRTPLATGSVATFAAAQTAIAAAQATDPGYDPTLDGDNPFGLSTVAAPAAARGGGVADGANTDQDGAVRNVDLYRATLIGDQAYAIADSLPVELRDNGVEDFGRTHSLAWYAIWGCGVLNPDHGCNIITS